MDVPFFPTLNASLNGLAGVLLIVGYALIRQRRVEWHRRVMLAAFGVSTLFLLSYLYYHFQIGGTKRFPGTGTIRTVYLGILITHTVLASAVPFLALASLWRGLGGQYDLHRKVARWTLPIWLYVSVTGVVVYWMLYRMNWS